MGNTRIEDIQWVPNPWNSTTKLNFIPPSSSSCTSSNGHNQEIIEYDNGLILIDDFLSEDEYQMLLETIKDEFKAMEEATNKNPSVDLSNNKDPSSKDDSQTPSNPNPTPSKPKKPRRLALHYGPKYDYTTNHSSPNPIPVPPHLKRLIDQITPHVEGVEMNQATIQFYPPGSGIPPHIDTHSCFSTHILSFSLGSSVNMSFQKANLGTKGKMFAPRRCVGGPTTSITNDQTPLNSSSYTKTSEGEERQHEIQLKPNSLCIMSKEIRYAWTHGIKTRSTDINPITGEVEKRKNRFSITFRKVDFDGKCGCDYGVWCDSQQEKGE